jgi:hypothetical protein
MINFLHFPVFIIAFLAAVIGAAIVALIRKCVSLHLLTPHHEVAFPIFLQLGVIYAVLLAFIFSMVLNELGESYAEAKRETTHLLTLAQLAPGFPEKTRRMIENTLIDYTKTVIYSEWPKMAHHQEDPQVSKILASLQKIYLNLNLQSSREEAIYANSLVHLAQLRENRRIRIFAVTEPNLGNPLVLLIMLGLIVVGISYFFGMEELWVQMILTGALIFSISAILMVIFMLRNPFASKFGISPRIFENTLVRLEEIKME